MHTASSNTGVSAPRFPIGQNVAPISMTSIELAEFINSHRRQQAESADKKFPSKGFAKLEHYSLMEKVPQVLGEVGAQNFMGTYLDAQNKPRPCYKFPKREACLLAMSYSYELQAAVYDRMTEREAAVTPKLPTSFAAALRLAAEQAEQIEQQQAALAIAAPKAEFVDNYVEGTGLKGFRQVAKLLKANEAEFRLFLEDKKIMYRLGGEWMPFGIHIGAKRFEVKTGQADSGHAFNTAKFTPKGIAWVAGLWAQHKLEVAP